MFLFRYLSLAACLLISSSKITALNEEYSAIEHTAAVVKKDSLEGLYFSTHIIWEGLEIKEYNLKKLVEFRTKHKNLPVIHLISPSYASNSLKRYKLKNAIEKVFKKGDKVGVYLSGWKNIVEEANVDFKAGNSFWGNQLKSDCRQCGSETPLTNYNSAELKKIIEWSIEEVDDLGLGTPTSSLIAGWQSNQDILNILADNNIKVDFSMIAPYRTVQTLKHQHLYHLLLDLWGYRSESLSPIARQFSSDKIFQIPNNFAHPGIIPYSYAKPMLDQLFNAIERDTYKGATVSIMVSQSRADKDIHQLSRFAKELYNNAKRKKIDVMHLLETPIFSDPESIKLSRSGTWSWPNTKPASSQPL